MGREKNEEIRKGIQQRQSESLGSMTDIICVLVRLMGTWHASSSCQQASDGKLSLVHNDLYLHPV